MRNNVFEYKEYIGSAEVDPESKTLFGRLLFITDVIAYSGNTVDGLEAAFREAVDDYLQTCKDAGDIPDVPCKGTFNVRVGPVIHRDVALAARRIGLGLNEFVCKALAEATKTKPTQFIEHLHRHDHAVHVTLQSPPITAPSSKQSKHWETLGETAAKH